MEDKEGQSRNLLTSFVQIEAGVNRFIKNTLNAVADHKLKVKGKLRERPDGNKSMAIQNYFVLEDIIDDEKKTI